MVICQVCGTKNLDTADFCTNCGAYLAWDRDTESGRASDPAATQQPAPRQQSADAEAEQPVIPTRHHQRAQAEPGPQPVPQVARGSREPAGADAAALTPAPPAPPATPGRKEAPEAVKPGERVFVPPPAAPALEDRPAPGQLICPNCGTGNDPQRKFCRRCAHSLADAAAAPQPSWWRRVFGPRPRAARPAGSRPRRRRRFPTRVVVFVVVLALTAATVYALRDFIGSAITRGQDQLGQTTIHPVNVVASTSIPGRGAELTRDQVSTTSWATDVEDATGQYLDAFFAEPIRLVYVIITPGASHESDAFVAERRPGRVRLIPMDSAGNPMDVREVDLRDEAGDQSFYVGADDVLSLRLEILTVRGPESAPVAIAEVEYRERRSATEGTSPTAGPSP